MLDQDPGFVGGDETLWSSYYLAEDSTLYRCCISDTTGYYMTSMDLNGHEKVFGTAVDLGCFEYGSPVPNSDNEEVGLVKSR